MQTVIAEKTSKRSYKEPLLISEFTRVDLKKIFPPSDRFAIKRSLPWLIATLIFSAAVAVALLLEDSISGRDLSIAPLIFISILTLFSICAYVYGKLYANSMYYSIDGYRLVVKRGVIFKRTGSVPIAGFHETYVFQSLLDVICGVYTFSHLVWFDKGSKLTTIEGLSKKSAYGLQKLISDLQSKQVAFYDKIQLRNPLKEHLLLN